MVLRTSGLNTVVPQRGLAFRSSRSELAINRNASNVLSLGIVNLALKGYHIKTTGPDSVTGDRPTGGICYPSDVQSIRIPLSPSLRDRGSLIMPLTAIPDLCAVASTAQTLSKSFIPTHGSMPAIQVESSSHANSIARQDPDT